MSGFRDLHPDELARWRDAALPHVLLDVRESHELALARLEGALHIPMGQVAQRIDELPADTTVVVMCHHGGRSARVARFLAANRQSTTVYNLVGGIDAYARAVDPSIGRYA